MYVNIVEKPIGKGFYTTNNKLSFFKVNGRSLEAEALSRKIDFMSISKYIVINI